MQEDNRTSWLFSERPKRARLCSAHCTSNTYVDFVVGTSDEPTQDLISTPYYFHFMLHTFSHVLAPLSPTLAVVVPSSPPSFSVNGFRSDQPFADMISYAAALCLEDCTCQWAWRSLYQSARRSIGDSIEKSVRKEEPVQRLQVSSQHRRRHLQHTLGYCGWSCIIGRRMHGLDMSCYLVPNNQYLKVAYVPATRLMLGKFFGYH